MRTRYICQGLAHWPDMSHYTKKTSPWISPPEIDLEGESLESHDWGRIEDRGRKLILCPSCIRVWKEKHGAIQQTPPH